jgi:tetratricopeptide (TPR) repeat protein
VTALEAARKLTTLVPADRLTLAIAYQATRKQREALGTISGLVKEFPLNSEYGLVLGQFDAEDKHLEEAVADFQNVLQMDPGLLRAYENLGQVQEDLGRTDDARKTYEAGVAKNRRNGARWERLPIDLGVLLLKAGDLDQAQNLFSEALQYNPRAGWAHYFMGQIDQKRDRRQDAITEYTAAVTDVPDLRQAWLALGREYTRAGQKEQAEKCLAIFRNLEARDTARRNGGGPAAPPAAAEKP